MRIRLVEGFAFLGGGYSEALGFLVGFATALSDIGSGRCIGGVCIRKGGEGSS